MKAHTVVLIIIILLAALGIIAYKLLSPAMAEDLAQKTSDARDMKGTVKIALDSWIGYYPLQSPVFKKLMRDEKYNLEISDDNADYAARMRNLKLGTINFAAATIDSYLLNAAAEGFPGTIVCLIDESKGGDAIVAWKNQIDSIEKLKSVRGYKIAFTPASPSEHLLKSIGAHFNIAALLEKQGAFRLETNGAEEAYHRLLNREAAVAVLWEPHVTDALAEPGIVKLLGSEDTEKLIVDILLVNRSFAEKNPTLVRLLLAGYFNALQVYAENPAKLKEDIIRERKSSAAKVDAMLKGVSWVSLTENARWYGLLEDSRLADELVGAIEATMGILIENGDFTENPLPNRDPATIINSRFIKEIFEGGGETITPAAERLTKKFNPLTAEEWSRLKDVGTLKIRPITFTSGTAELTARAEEEIELIVSNLRHYPNFRILVKGHTDVRGDEGENLLLSQKRADTVARQLSERYGIDRDRVRSLGVGGRESLPRQSNESNRAYNDRLKRVEIHLLAGEN